jgi:pimeloyl-ACP methyl ester carboxylesterase
MTTMAECDRAFLRLPEGLLHYRHAGWRQPAGTAAAGVTVAGGAAGAGAARGAGAGAGTGAGAHANALPPVWMMHASPASSRSTEPLALALAMRHGRAVVAPDTPGNGDSAPLAVPQPEVADYADAFVRALDALGIAQADLYGYHTGAHVAIEMALAHPSRVRRLVLDGLLWLEDEAERAEYLAQYAPPLRPDANGTQVFTALQFIRDMAWFFPHFRRDPAHNLRGGAMPPELLHTLTVDLLKAATTYHLAYRAVFRHRLEARLPQLASHPVLLMADAGDPTRPGVARAAALVPGARQVVIEDGWSPEGLAAKAHTIADFLAG